MAQTNPRPIDRLTQCQRRLVSKLTETFGRKSWKSFDVAA